MRRLNDTELNKRIGKFINKKLQKYPNLTKTDKADTKSMWRIDKMIEGVLGRALGRSRSSDYVIKP